jgi:hypothetical protein
VNEALDAIKESQKGTHCLTVYPDLLSLRAIYASFTKILLENNNEIILVLPYYETLSKANVDSCEEQQEEDHDPHTIDTRKSMDLMEFLDVLIKHAARRRKDCVTV